MTRVPALLLETAAVAGQDLKSLKVVDIVTKQRRPTPSVRSVERKGWKQVCEFLAPNERRDQYPAAPARTRRSRDADQREMVQVHLSTEGRF